MTSLLKLKANHMSEEFPVLSATPFQGLLTPGQLGQGQDKFRTFVERIHYKVIGYLTATLDYVLIVTAGIVAGIGYHAVVRGKMFQIRCLT